MRSETYMSKINLQRGKLTVENRRSREKKRICSEVSVNSGVTMGWLLRLVTGGPTGGRGPPTVLFYFKSEGRGPDLRK